MVTLLLKQINAKQRLVCAKKTFLGRFIVGLVPLSANRQQKILGITGKDISTKVMRQNNFRVMVLSFMPGNVCVISDYRLQRHGATAEQVSSELLKVALQELGH